MRVPPESIPKIYFLLKALEEVPDNLRISKNGGITFKSLIKYIKRNNKKLYEDLMVAYGCREDSCLARAMSNTFIFLLERHISFQGRPERVGDVYGQVKELVQRLHPILRV